MHDHPLMRRLAEWRGLMNQVTQLDHPLGDSARHRFNLLQRADHFAIELASTSPHDRLDTLALAELTYDLSDTPVIRRAAGHVILGIKTIWP